MGEEVTRNWASVPLAPCVSPADWPQTPVSCLLPCFRFAPSYFHTLPPKVLLISCLLRFPVFLSLHANASAWNVCSSCLRGTCQAALKLSVRAACSSLPWCPVPLASVCRVLCSGLSNVTEPRRAGVLASPANLVSWLLSAWPSVPWAPAP